MRSPLTRGSFRSVLQVAALAVGLSTTRASFADHYRVPSGSMEPTVHTGDHILVDKVAYGLRVPMTDTWVARFDGPKRGDVVVLSSPEDGTTVLLKRIAAVEGEIVEVRRGHVSIDGRTVAEPWASLAVGWGPDFGPVVVPPGKVLVLGDNRGNSRDGRSIGWVDTRDVFGRAVAVVARDGRPSYETLSKPASGIR
jgi:signal peptidase I